MQITGNIFMKRYLIKSIILVNIFFILSCMTSKFIKCDYSELLNNTYEEMQDLMRINDSKYYLISGIVKKIDKPKDQPRLNECVIYFYNDDVFNDNTWVGKFITIKMHSSISDDYINKTVTIKCKYKKMNKINISENYNNYFSIKFEKGEIYE